MEICIDIRTDCKNKCVFCAKTYLEEPESTVDTIDRIKSEILSKIDDKGDFYIWWAEPLNFKYIIDVIKFIKDNSTKKIIIKTSGVIENLEYVNEELISLIDRIQVPCHSIKEKDFNNIHWNNNAYKKYIDFLNKLETINMVRRKIIFHTLILKENYKVLPDILLYINRLFWVQELVLVYPISPDKELSSYYDITVSKDTVIQMNWDFIDNWIFKLINFDE